MFRVNFYVSILEGTMISFSSRTSIMALLPPDVLFNFSNAVGGDPTADLVLVAKVNVKTEFSLSTS